MDVDIVGLIDAVGTVEEVAEDNVASTAMRGVTRDGTAEGVAGWGATWLPPTRLLSFMLVVGCMPNGRDRVQAAKMAHTAATPNSHLRCSSQQQQQPTSSSSQQAAAAANSSSMTTKTA